MRIHILQVRKVPLNGTLRLGPFSFRKKEVSLAPGFMRQKSKTFLETFSKEAEYLAVLGIEDR